MRQRIELKKLLDTYGLPDVPEGTKQYIPCPFRQLHGSKSDEREATIGQTPSGYIYVRCFHTNCADDLQKLESEINTLTKFNIKKSDTKGSFTARMQKQLVGQRTAQLSDRQQLDYIRGKAHDDFVGYLNTELRDYNMDRLLGYTKPLTEKHHTIQFLDAMFCEEDLLWTGQTDDASKRHHFRKKKDIVFLIEGGEWKEREHPFTTSCVFASGADSRCDATVYLKKYMVFESDTLTRDESARCILFLISICPELRLRAITHSGSKSYHFWFDTIEWMLDLITKKLVDDKDVNRERRDMMNRWLNYFGIDTIVFRISQPFRLAGSERKKDERYVKQALLYLMDETNPVKGIKGFSRHPAYSLFTDLKERKKVKTLSIDNLPTVVLSDEEAAILEAKCLKMATSIGLPDEVLYPEIFVIPDKDAYYLKNESGTFEVYNQQRLQRQLVDMGYARSLDEGESQSEVERVLTHVESGNRVADARALNGYHKGVHFINGNRVLVTSDFSIPKVEKGNCDLLTELDRQMFGDQLLHWKSWMKVALMGQVDPEYYRSGQATIFVGPVKSFKSERCLIFVEQMGGTVCLPEQYINGDTSFNKEFADAAVWFVDDPVLPDSYQSSRTIISRIKKFTISNVHQVHEKNKTPYSYSLKKRILLAMNDDEKAMTFLMGLFDSAADKFNLYRTDKPNMEIPREIMDYPVKLRALFNEQVPAYNYHLLHEFTIPDEFYDNRLGIGYYHNQVIRDGINLDVPAQVLLEKLFTILDDLGATNYQVVGNASEISTLLNTFYRGKDSTDAREVGYAFRRIEKHSVIGRCIQKSPDKDRNVYTILPVTNTQTLGVCPVSSLILKARKRYERVDVKDKHKIIDTKIDPVAGFARCVK